MWWASVVCVHQEPTHLSNGNTILLFYSIPCYLSGMVSFPTPAPRADIIIIRVISLDEPVHPRPIQTLLVTIWGIREDYFQLLLLSCQIKVWGHFLPCDKSPSNKWREKWNPDTFVLSLDSTLKLNLLLVCLLYTDISDIIKDQVVLSWSLKNPKETEWVPSFWPKNLNSIAKNL
jgi:hypothetical protein